MNNIEPRRIEELVARYKLEPTIKDIFVEGSTDKSLVQWFLEEETKRDVFVYEISTVLIPNDLVLELKQETNRRGQVYALAYTLQRCVGANSQQATCVIDRDFANLLGEDNVDGILFLTDYACMEMYAFNVPTIDKFLKIIVRGFPKSATVVLQELAEVLQELFLIRLANKLMEFSLKHISWERCCSLVGLQLSFDVSEYIGRYLNTRGRRTQIEEFTFVINEWRVKLSEDPRHQIQGHDFIEFLTWYIYKHRGVKEVNDEAVIQRSLLGCIERTQLMQEPLFQTLLTRI